MATAAQLETELQDATRLIHNLWTNQTLDADRDTLKGNLQGDLSDRALDAAERTRARVDDALAGIRELLEVWSENYLLDVVDQASRGFLRDFREIREYFNANNVHVQSRGISFGSQSGSTTGDGTISRLTVDEFNRSIESDQASTKTLEVTADQVIGNANPHEEVFKFRDARGQAQGSRLGTNFATGQVREGGSRFRARSSRDSLINNPGFQDVGGSVSFSGGTAALSSSNSLTGWTFDTGQIEDHDLDRNNVAEASIVGVENPHSFLASAAFKISRPLDEDNVSIDFDAPYHLSVWVRPDGSADGDVILTLGSQTTTQAVSGLTANQWNYVEIAVDQNRWPRNWNTATPTVAVEWTGTAGTAGFDAVILARMARFPTSGTYWHIASGQTLWIKGDEVTYTDTISSDSKINFLCSLEGTYLNAVADATQVAASGGRTLTFADADPDTITASSGDFASDGYEAGMLLTVSGTSSNDGTYLIASVTATVITLDASETLAAEGPLSSGETLDATAHITDPA